MIATFCTRVSLQRCLSNAHTGGEIKVSTVDGYQGGEKGMYMCHPSPPPRPAAAAASQEPCRCLPRALCTHVRAESSQDECPRAAPRPSAASHGACRVCAGVWQHQTPAVWRNCIACFFPIIGVISSGTTACAAAHRTAAADPRVMQAVADPWMVCLPCARCPRRPQTSSCSRAYVPAQQEAWDSSVISSA